jgi:hypothetical protein
MNKESFSKRPLDQKDATSNSILDQKGISSKETLTDLLERTCVDMSDYLPRSNPMNRPTGGPAFPVDNRTNQGMTLRDYFAGQALTGLIAGVYSGGAMGLALQAYEAADAMIEARNKE